MLLPEQELTRLKPEEIDQYGKKRAPDAEEVVPNKERTSI
jgi:hypothetical protein